MERQIVVPVTPSRLWEALTDPAQVEGWFGGRVRWDLEPGGPLRVVEPDGTVREGVVEAVDPERVLRFSWWPAAGDHDGASEVTYRLEPVVAPETGADGTLLTVTEEPAGEPVDRAERDAPSASIAAPGGRVDLTWSAWDGRLAGVWGRATAPVVMGVR